MNLGGGGETQTSVHCNNLFRSMHVIPLLKSFSSFPGNSPSHGLTHLGWPSILPYLHLLYTGLFQTLVILISSYSRGFLFVTILKAVYWQTVVWLPRHLAHGSSLHRSFSDEHLKEAAASLMPHNRSCCSVFLLQSLSRMVFSSVYVSVLLFGLIH